MLRPQLEERLEIIISGAALLADSLSTREDRRDRIVNECNLVRQALQELLEEYIQRVNNPFSSDLVLSSENYSSRKKNDLKKISMKKFNLCNKKLTIYESR